MKKRVLHLTLLKKWFEEIASGRKREEYRDIKPYWTKRLEKNSYDEVWFKNGYNKDAPFMRIEWKGIKKDNDKYIIYLGKVLEIKNY